MCCCQRHRAGSARAPGSGAAVTDLHLQVGGGKGGEGGRVCSGGPCSAAGLWRLWRALACAGGWGRWRAGGLESGRRGHTTLGLCGAGCCALFAVSRPLSGAGAV
ncbi:MAG: hypothetical protein ACK559_20580, partial [bacterium]